VPGEVGKVGVESPTFIEPVQKRKDGIEAMFMRQANKAKESASPSSSAAAGRTVIGNKRKHEPSSSPSPAEVKDETRTPVTSPSSPAKRIKPDKSDHPIKPTEIVDVDIDVGAGEPAEDDNKSSSGDIEILSSPGPSTSQPVIVPPPLNSSLSHSIYELLFPKVAKPKTKKNERDDTPLSSGSQQQPSSSQTTPKKKSDVRTIPSLVSFLCVLIEPFAVRICVPCLVTQPAVTRSPRKKKEVKKTESSSKSTPKITSFFAKSAG